MNKRQKKKKRNRCLAENGYPQEPFTGTQCPYCGFDYSEYEDEDERLKLAGGSLWRKNMVTNLEEIKENAKILCRVVKLEPIAGILLNHPYADCVLQPASSKIKTDLAFMNIESDKNAYNEWEKRLFEMIDKCDKAEDVYFLVRDSWKLTFLKFIKPYTERSEFSRMFGDAWITVENTSSDVNCPLKMLVKWFKEADKSALMGEQDLEVYESLPEEFTAYRGVVVNGNPNGLSWTRNLAKAKWFAKRFNQDGKEGYVIERKVNKREVFAYFGIIGEDEVVLDIQKQGERIKRWEAANKQ